MTVAAPKPLPFTKQLKLIFHHYVDSLRVCDSLEVHKIYITDTVAQTYTHLTFIVERVEWQHGVLAVYFPLMTFSFIFFYFIDTFSHVLFSKRQKGFSDMNDERVPCILIAIV